MACVAAKALTGRVAHGRPVPIFAGAFGDQNRGLLNEKMRVSRGDVDTASFKRLAFFSHLAPEGNMPSQPVQQRFSGAFRRHVMNDEKRGGKVGRQASQQDVENVQTSGRMSRSR